MKYLYSKLDKIVYQHPESLKLSGCYYNILGIIIVIVMLFGISCKQDKSIQLKDSGLRSIPNRFILKSDKDLSIKNDIISWKDSLYSGFLYELNLEGKDTLLLEGYIDGLLNGDCKKWYPKIQETKQLMEKRTYLDGKKNGKQIAYWANGNKRFEFMAVNDGYEGEMKEWSEDGKLFHLALFVNGQEDGVQKMWYENGKIRANYVIIKGKRYGLLGTKNCKNVSDSIFVVK